MLWHRLEIASCSEHAYTSLSIKDAQSLLMIPTDEEVDEFIYEVCPCEVCASDSCDTSHMALPAKL